MANKDNLRKQRTGTIINKFSVKLEHESNMYLKDIVTKLQEIYPDVGERWGHPPIRFVTL
jgi:hypothetical protein